MSVQDPSTDKLTLGQRIDALLGPLDHEAQAFREAITSGRAQLAQMQSRIDQAEQALAGIEGKMVRVLQSLAAEEPMLALAMGVGDTMPPMEAQPTGQTSPVPSHEDVAPSSPGSPLASMQDDADVATSEPPLPTPVWPADPVASAENAAAPEASAQSFASETAEPSESDSPPVVTLEMASNAGDGEDEAALGQAPPTPEEDAAAVDEIMGLLNTSDSQPEKGAAGGAGSSLAAAAAQADAVARSLDAGV